MKKAIDFLNSADALGIIVDSPSGRESFVQLCILAGIAAADVICCTRLGFYHQGDDHNQAVKLLATIDQTQAKNLAILLKMKTRSGYGHRSSAAEDRTRAGRAASSLVEEARSL